MNGKLCRWREGRDRGWGHSSESGDHKEGLPPTGHAGFWASTLSCDKAPCPRWGGPPTPWKCNDPCTPKRNASPSAEVTCSSRWCPHVGAVSRECSRRAGSVTPGCDTPKCREQKLAVNQEPGKRSAVPHGDMASGFIGEASRQLHNRPRGIAQRLKEVGTKNLSKETGCMGSPAGHASSPLPKSMLSPLGGSWVSARQRMLSRAGPEGIGPELLVTIFS